MKQFTEELLRMDEDDVAHLVTIDTGCTTRFRREKKNAVLGVLMVLISVQGWQTQ